MVDWSTPISFLKKEMIDWYTRHILSWNKWLTCIPERKGKDRSDIPDLSFTRPILSWKEMVDWYSNFVLSRNGWLVFRTRELSWDRRRAQPDCSCWSYILVYSIQTFSDANPDGKSNPGSCLIRTLWPGGLAVLWPLFGVDFSRSIPQSIKWWMIGGWRVSYNLNKWTFLECTYSLQQTRGFLLYSITDKHFPVKVIQTEIRGWIELWILSQQLGAVWWLAKSISKTVQIESETLQYKFLQCGCNVFTIIQ